MPSTNTAFSTEQPTEVNGEKVSFTKSNVDHDSKRNGEMWILRITKYTAISLVVFCALIGTIVNKVTLVSITGRMHNLYNSTGTSLQKEKNGSKLYIELVMIMVIPDFVSFFRCLIWGVIGKTTETFPWPTWKSVLLVRIYYFIIVLLFTEKTF